MSTTTMYTASGLAINLMRPTAGDVLIDDIAHHLALANRFCGATVRPYSVAEHSLLCMWIAEIDLRMTDPAGLLAVLLHDAHEAYMGDLIQPLKSTLRLCGTPLAAVEGALERAVGDRFGLGQARHAYRGAIKRADLIALATERRDLMPQCQQHHWPLLADVAPSAGFRLTDTGAAEMPWTYWREAFLAQYRLLTGQLQPRQQAEPNRAA